MIRKKSKGWTFIFSLLPGAGEMYMGFMKQGVSIMGLFFATIAVAATLNIGPLTIVLPIIWCYSFFNVHNMYSLSDEEFYALEDDYIFYLDRILPINQWSKQQNKIVAGILIIAGICIFWNECVDYLIGSWIYVWFSESIANSISQFLHTLPRLTLIQTDAENHPHLPVLTRLQIPVKNAVPLPSFCAVPVCIPVHAQISGMLHWHYHTGRCLNMTSTFFLTYWYY